MNTQLLALASRLCESLESQDLAFWKALQDEADALRLSEEDEETANAAWFLREVARARGGFVDCVEKMRAGEFREAWCDLEHVEITLIWLRKNPFFSTAQFALESLGWQVSEWQKLYPYKLFFSPEIVVERAECSICGLNTGLWSKCDHRVGKVYKGELCCRKITGAKILSVSVVTDPVQKYSALILPDENGNDSSDYSLVKFVVDRIDSPFSRWSGRWTRAYHSHRLYDQIDASEGCPCDSGRLYSDCCLQRPGVIRPHYQIAFDSAPSSPFPMAGLAGY